MNYCIQYACHVTAIKWTMSRFATHWFLCHWQVYFIRAIMLHVCHVLYSKSDLYTSFIIAIQHAISDHIGQCNNRNHNVTGLFKILTSLPIWELCNFHFLLNYTSLNIWVRYFVQNFKGASNSRKKLKAHPHRWGMGVFYELEVPLKFHTKYLTHTLKATQNILPIH